MPLLFNAFLQAINCVYSSIPWLKIKIKPIISEQQPSLRKTIFIKKCMLKLEHIGIAVKSISSSMTLFETLLNTNCYKQEIVASENVNTAFFKKGETKIELLESTNADGVISRYIEKKGEGIHHLAFEVEDIYAEMDRLKSAGFTLLNEKPKDGADNKLVCFLHPKDTNSVLVELCMEKKSIG